MAAIFSDTTLTPESGYAAVNNRQVYDEVATRLGAHPAWSLVDTQDWVSGSNTFTTNMWKCSAAVSGLPNDFYVALRRQWTTIGAVHPAANGLIAMLFEDYDPATKIASKPAPPQVAASVNIAADNTHPGTWNITAATTASSAYVTLPPIISGTTCRVIMIVDKDMFTVQGNGTTAAAPQGCYVGAIDSFLSPADDPMPIVIGAANTGATNMSVTAAIAQGFSCTRHPKLTGPQTHVFSLGISNYHASTGPALFGLTPLLTASGSAAMGVLGDPASTANGFYAPPLVSKIPLATQSTAQTASTRGGLRGTLKHYRGAALAGHSIGDTFLVDGATYIGFGATLGGILPVAP